MIKVWVAFTKDDDDQTNEWANDFNLQPGHIDETTISQITKSGYNSHIDDKNPGRWWFNTPPSHKQMFCCRFSRIPVFRKSVTNIVGPTRSHSAPLRASSEPISMYQLRGLARRALRLWRWTPSVLCASCVPLVSRACGVPAVLPFAIIDTLLSLHSDFDHICPFLDYYLLFIHTYTRMFRNCRKCKKNIHIWTH